jgi:hypothetical protein
MSVQKISAFDLGRASTHNVRLIMSYIGSTPISVKATLQGTLKQPVILQTLLECVLPAEVDSIATSLMSYYQMNGLGYQILDPVLQHYLSSPGELIVA